MIFGCRTSRAPTRGFLLVARLFQCNVVMAATIRSPARSASERSRSSSSSRTLGFAVAARPRIALTECQMVNQFKGSATEALVLHPWLRPCFRPERAQDHVDGAGRSLLARARSLDEEVTAPAQDEEFVMSHSDNVQATGFVEHLKLPHYTTSSPSSASCASCGRNSPGHGRTMCLEMQEAAE